jgi:bifunctional NMN adenylyltransferase/nudix hydrolase
MMHRDYSVAVIIGRFQPFHNNHAKLVEQGLRIADKVLILVGSAYAARSPKNPFTFEERKSMIMDCFPFTMPVEPGPAVSTKYSGRIFVEPIRDYFYSDDVWLANVQTVCSNHIEDGETVALLGAYKDSSSYYLNLFPQWEYVPPEYADMMDATSVREALFDVSYSKGWGDRGEVPKFTDETLEKQDKFFVENVPSTVANFLRIFRDTTPFIALACEYEANEAYKKSWENSPFPPIFVTADAVVTCSGHVLVIKRGGNPGKGLLALPGGFVRENERVKPAALRELKEETRIKVDKIILESSIVDSEVFDYPARSLRGRTITHAFHVKLRDGKLPEVKGGDDATGAFWLPMMEVMRRADEFFEDHIHIINRFINK